MAFFTGLFCWMFSVDFVFRLVLFTGFCWFSGLVLPALFTLSRLFISLPDCSHRRWLDGCSFISRVSFTGSVCLHVLSLVIFSLAWFVWRCFFSQAFYDEVGWMNILSSILGDQLMVESAQDPLRPLILCPSTIISSNPAKVMLWRNYNYPSGHQSRWVVRCCWVGF